MWRLITGSLLILAIAVSGESHAQGVGQPLQLSPDAAAAPARTGHVKVPANWQVIIGRPDPLTGETSPKAQTTPKAPSIVNGKPVPTLLIMRCGYRVRGLEDASLSVRFASLTGVGHFKKFEARYRFDESDVQQFTATSKVGKNHAREFKLDSGNPDPGIEIAGATRLRMQMNFQSAGVTFLDFNVSGATQALDALACPD
jgi:hypothetical protein